MTEPLTLLPFQSDWIEDNSDVKVAEKSRQIGLSWSEACDSVITAATEGRGGMNVWYIGTNKEMTFEFVRDCEKWIPELKKKANEIKEESRAQSSEGELLEFAEEIIIHDEDYDKDILAYRITFASGHRITALSSRPSNLRGKRGKVIIDEAAFHEDLRGLIKAAMALLMWGGRVSIISTHFGADNPFNDIIKEILAGKKSYSLHRITFMEAVLQGLYKKICAKLDKDWTQEAEDAWVSKMYENYGDDADEELDCIPAQGSGAYFPRVMIEQCQRADIPVISWQCKTEFATEHDDVREAAALAWLMEFVEPHLQALNKNEKHWFGEDFGRSGDLSVFAPLAEQVMLHYRIPFLVELRNVPFRQQEQILFYILDRLPNFQGGAMDARGNGQSLAEFAMQRYGENRIKQIMLTVEYYRLNFPPYKTALEDQSLDIPKHADVLNDHLVVKMDKGVARIPDKGRFKGSDGGQRHGDAVIALMLAWFARGEIVYQKPDHKTVEGRKAKFKAGAY